MTDEDVSNGLHYASRLLGTMAGPASYSLHPYLATDILNAPGGEPPWFGPAMDRLLKPIRDGD